MNIAFYTFYLESEAGIPATNLNPQIELVKVIPDALNVSGNTLAPINATLVNLNDGLYGFSFDWDILPAWVFFGVNPDPFNGLKRSLFVRIDTGLTSQDQKYISMRLERHDILPDLVDTLQVSANSLSTSSDALKAVTDKILQIEEGSWIVENNTLLIFDKTEVDRIEGNAIATFDLKDQQGNPTTENPFKRIAR
jgi:hypothetical protein